MEADVGPVVRGSGGATAVAPEVESFYHLGGVNVGCTNCQGLACFVARHLSPAKCGRSTTESAPRVYCLGKCYSAPVTGGEDCKPARVVDAREPIVLERMIAGGAASLDEYRRRGGYRALEAALQLPAEEVVRMVEASGLRGRGGAGFPTGRKWRAVASRRSGPAYLVVNADEGDPGAYVDRFILEEDPHALVEGMTIAAYAVGAVRGWIYVRCEYPEAERALGHALEEARDAGFLGRRVRGTAFSFDAAIHTGRGSYVCGEETALLNSIEGRRPVARVRPPYPAEQGLFGKPTLVNNVETLATVPWIVREGADVYHALGSSHSRGTKVVCLNSLFARPGMYEVEFGIPLRRIVEDLGGGLRGGAELRGVIIGGPLAGIVPPQLLDTPFGFEELRAIGASVGHGGVVAFDSHTSLAELVHHVFGFAAFESCGHCFPCRLGCRRVEQIFARAARTPPADRCDRQEWIDLVEMLSATSLCGLGSGAAEFAQSVLKYYSREVDPCFA